MSMRVGMLCFYSRGPVVPRAGLGLLRRDFDSRGPAVSPDFPRLDGRPLLLFFFAIGDSPPLVAYRPRLSGRV